MNSETIHELDNESLQLFAAKGTNNNQPRIDNPNGYKVRRVMQIIKCLAKEPFNQLGIMDLACGEGVYSIEAGMRGAEVFAFDARRERMDQGIRVKESLGLDNVLFSVEDIRKINKSSWMQADVVLLLGILYHLDKDDIYPVLKNIYEICREFIVIDTHIALQGNVRISYDNKVYEGIIYKEHNAEDAPEVKQKRLLASIDNPESFWFTKASLVRLLQDIGFSSIVECLAPEEPGKPADRITLVAIKGEPVVISTYPWVNGK